MREAIEVTVPPGTQPEDPRAADASARLLPEHDVTTVGRDSGDVVRADARRLHRPDVARADRAGAGCRSRRSPGRRCGPSSARSSALGQAPGRHPSKLWTLLGSGVSRRISGRAGRRCGSSGCSTASDLPAPTQQHLGAGSAADKFRLDLAYPEVKARDRVRRVGHAPDAERVRRGPPARPHPAGQRMGRPPAHVEDIRRRDRRTVRCVCPISRSLRHGIRTNAGMGRGRGRGSGEGGG